MSAWSRSGLMRILAGKNHRDLEVGVTLSSGLEAEGFAPDIALGRLRVPSRPARVAAAMIGVLANACLASCASGHQSSAPPGTSAAGRPVPARVPTRVAGSQTSTTSTTSTTPTTLAPRFTPLPAPSALAPFAGSPGGGGTWTAAGRRVDGIRAVYETTLVPPGGTEAAGIAWMDTRLLSAGLYSGSVSPGGGPYRYTAPIEPAQAVSLVAAFNGGFKMAVANGGYYTEGQMIYPLQTGAASLVIYNNGEVNIGAWGRDVTMTPNVVAVRQNLAPILAGGGPTAAAATGDWLSWGATCGANSCSAPGIENQWRSGVGITADGALVYVTGPALDPLQLAQLLARAGAVRGMQLDINPYWTVFVTYDPAAPSGLAGPANGQKLLASTTQGPATFFDPGWARDFITMSARTSPPG
jgi:hypothetical protein